MDTLYQFTGITDSDKVNDIVNYISNTKLSSASPSIGNTIATPKDCSNPNQWISSDNICFPTNLNTSCRTNT